MFKSLLVVALVAIIAWFGSQAGLGSLFGVVLPYVAIAIFLVGVVSGGPNLQFLSPSRPPAVRKNLLISLNRPNGTALTPPGVLSSA